MKILVIITCYIFVLFHLNQNNAVNEFRGYALNIKITDQGMPKLPKLSKKEKELFIASLAEDSFKTNQSIAYILMLFYEKQMHCCKQSFELCQDSTECPLEYEFLTFNKLINNSDDDDFPPELITTGYIYSFLEEHQFYFTDFPKLEQKIKSLSINDK